MIKVKIYEDVNSKNTLIGTYELLMLIEKINDQYSLGLFNVGNNQMKKYYFDENDIIDKE